MESIHTSAPMYHPKTKITKETYRTDWSGRVGSWLTLQVQLKVILPPCRDSSDRPASPQHMVIRWQHFCCCIQPHFNNIWPRDKRQHIPPSPTYYTIAPSSGQASLVSCTCAWWQVNRHQRTCIHCVHVIYITLIGTLCLSWGTTLVRECVCVCVMLMLLPSKASCNPSRVTKAIRSVCIVPEYAPTPPGEVDDVANVVSFTLLPFTVLKANDRKSQRRSLNSMNSKQRSTTSATSEWQLLKSTI